MPQTAQQPLLVVHQCPVCDKKQRVGATSHQETRLQSATVRTALTLIKSLKQHRCFLYLTHRIRITLNAAKPDTLIKPTSSLSTTNAYITHNAQASFGCVTFVAARSRRYSSVVMLY